MKGQELFEEALRLLDKGLLPADLTNVWIFTKILATILLIAVLSGFLGFYIGISVNNPP